MAEGGGGGASYLIKEREREQEGEGQMGMQVRGGEGREQLGMEKGERKLLDLQLTRMPY